MKKSFFLAACVMCAVFMLFACFSQENSRNSGSILDYVDVETSSITEENVNLTKLVYTQNGEASNTFEITDADEIYDILDAILNVTVEEKTDVTASDSEDIFTFFTNDGKEFTFTFNMHNLVTEDGNYTLSDDEDLWKLAKEIS